MTEPEFIATSLTAEEAFWAMQYFLQEHYELSGGTFDVSDILSACEPVTIAATKILVPADSGMIHFWNDAIEKYRSSGIPPLKTLTPPS